MPARTPATNTLTSIVLRSLLLSHRVSAWCGLGDSSSPVAPPTQVGSGSLPSVTAPLQWGKQVSSALATNPRPQPPSALRSAGRDAFTPAPDVLAWIRRTFIDESGVLCNPDHKHLTIARVGVLWTNVDYSKGGKTVVGTAEMPQSQGGAWKAGRHDQQLREWFGFDPEFLITLHAPTLVETDDRGFCAVAEHELYHCGQARDDFGQPRFNRDTGRPIWAMRAHDVEEFIGVVSRYGAIGDVRLLVDAAKQAPAIGDDRVRSACGNCLARVA